MNPVSEIENGLPGHLDSPLAWDKNSFRCEKDYTHYLIDAEVKEIDDALEHFKGTVDSPPLVKADESSDQCS